MHENIIDNDVEEIFAKNIDETIICLEIHIDILIENANIFRKINFPSFSEKQEFILEFINLETNILNAFKFLIKEKIDDKHNQKLKALVNEFKYNWQDFQDTWEDDLWSIYDIIIQNEKNIIENIYNTESENKNKSIIKNADDDTKIPINTENSIHKDNIISTNNTQNMDDIKIYFEEIMERYKKITKKFNHKTHTLDKNNCDLNFDKKNNTKPNICKFVFKKDNEKHRGCLDSCCIIF